jgi:predicted DNA-binding transcriptional regulator YafY
MNHANKLRELNHVFSNFRQPVSINMLKDKLECSSSTIKRLITELRDRRAPLEYASRNEAIITTKALTSTCQASGSTPKNC